MNPDLLHAARRLRESGGSRDRRAAQRLERVYAEWSGVGLAAQLVALQIAHAALARPTTTKESS